jgi:excisionase family DNA binding protein
MATSANNPEEKAPAAAEDLSVSPRWARHADLERMYGLSRTTYWRLAKEGKIRAARVGRAVLVDCTSVEAYLEGLADDFE